MYKTSDLEKKAIEAIEIQQLFGLTIYSNETN